jgi:DNA (cytosine-5)-methyltransferase 1
MKPRLLDLFSCAGGAAMGYAQAGFEVVGVDIVPQPHYPFEHIVASWDEALAILPGLWEREGVPYAVHASPPCQRFSTMTRRHGEAQAETHPDLVDPVREALELLEVPWIIENVEGAPLRSPTRLCGSMFGLGAAWQGEQLQLRRHRLFEASMPLAAPGPCAHEGRAVGVYGHAGGRSRRDGLSFPGIDWMTGNELAEAIPPAYTRWLAQYLLAALELEPAPAGPVATRQLGLAL